MENQDGVAHDALLVAARPAERAVVKAQLRHGRAGPEFEVVEREIPFDRSGIIRCRRAERREQEGHQPDSFAHEG